MTLPVVPDVETILANSATTLREEVLPGLVDEWPRSCTRLVIAALEYAAELLGDDHAAVNRRELEAAVDGLRASLAGEAGALASAPGSAFDVAGRLLVWAREHPSADAEAIRAALHPVLTAQLDRESTASLPLVVALAQAMWGTG